MRHTNSIFICRTRRTRHEWRHESSGKLINKPILTLLLLYTVIFNYFAISTFDTDNQFKRVVRKSRSVEFTARTIIKVIMFLTSIYSFILHILLM